MVLSIAVAVNTGALDRDCRYSLCAKQYINIIKLKLFALFVYTFSYSFQLKFLHVAPLNRNLNA